MLPRFAKEMSECSQILPDKDFTKSIGVYFAIFVFGNRTESKKQKFVFKTIGVNWLSIFVNSGLSFVLAQMNATSCISGQNKMIVFYSVFVILHAVGGVKRFRV